MGQDRTTISLQEALTLQLDEMELLETAYPEVAFDTPDARPLLRAVLDESLGRQGLTDKLTEELHLQTTLANAPMLSFLCALSHKEAQLRVRLPHRYPFTPLVATVEGTPQLSASARKAIADATRLSTELRREPQCLEVLGAAMQTSADLADRELAGEQAPSVSEAGGSNEVSGYGGGGGGGGGGCGGTDIVPRLSHACSSGGGKRGAPHRSSNIFSTESDGPTSTERAGGCVFLGRRLIYSHHIIATQKRTGIVKAARDLGLGGFSKVGWPGVIVVEGEEGSCEDFVGIVRGWRWKHLAVRGEETSRVPDGRSLDQERCLPVPFEELGEKDGVSALAKRCREAGLGELFSTLLR